MSDIGYHRLLYNVLSTEDVGALDRSRMEEIEQRLCKISDRVTVVLAPRGRKRAFSNIAINQQKQHKRIRHTTNEILLEDTIDIKMYKEMFSSHFASEDQQEHMMEIANEHGKTEKGKLTYVEFEEMIKHLEEKKENKNEANREYYEEIYREGVI